MNDWTSFWNSDFKGSMFRISRKGNFFDIPNSLFWNVRRVEPSNSQIASRRKWKTYWQWLEWPPRNDEEKFKFKQIASTKTVQQKTVLETNNRQTLNGFLLYVNTRNKLSQINSQLAIKNDRDGHSKRLKTSLQGCPISKFRRS